MFRIAQWPTVVLGLATFLASPTAFGEASDWENIRWAKDLEQALSTAKKKGKLVYYFRLVGDLSTEHC